MAWMVVEPLKGGASWKEVWSLGDYAPDGDFGTLASLLSLLPSFHEVNSPSLLHTPVMVYCATTGPSEGCQENMD
jgi:hypothetical protein